MPPRPQDSGCREFESSPLDFHKESTKFDPKILVVAQIESSHKNWSSRMKRKSLVAVVLAGAMIFPTASAFADNASPAPVPTPSATSAADYQTLLAAYKAAVIKFEADRKAGLAAYVSALATYKSALIARHDQQKAINDAFKVAIQSARSSYQSSLPAAKTPADKAALMTVRDNAIAAATSKRDAAVTALGNPPIKPTHPTFTRPVRPLKPAKVVKPAKSK